MLPRYNPRYSPRSLRILVADDEPDSVAALKLLLNDEGHDVVALSKGSDVLRRVEDFRPDVLVLDLAMPDMSGYELAREIRNRMGAAVRIVALSGFGLPEDRARALEAGFDQHLVKPADAAFLKSLLG